MELTVEGHISSSGHLYLGQASSGGYIYGRRDGTGNEGYINIGGSATIATDGEIYLYAESSGNTKGYPNKQFVLRLPKINLKTV